MTLDYISTCIALFFIATAVAIIAYGIGELFYLRRKSLKETKIAGTKPIE